MIISDIFELISCLWMAALGLGLGLVWLLLGHMVTELISLESCAQLWALLCFQLDQLAVLITQSVFELIFNLVWVHHLGIVAIFKLLATIVSFIILRGHMEITRHLPLEIIMDSWVTLRPVQALVRI